MKENYIIKYEYQVLIPLMYMKEHNLGDELEQFQMLDYRIKTAQELAFNNILVSYETGNNALPRFAYEFADYVEIIEGESLTYRLKESFTLEMYDKLLDKLNNNIRNILTDKDIIKSCVSEKSLS